MQVLLLQGCKICIQQIFTTKKTTINKEYNVIVEIRAGEGGYDACLFVQELATAYIRHLDAVG